PSFTEICLCEGHVLWSGDLDISSAALDGYDLDAEPLNQIALIGHVRKIVGRTESAPEEIETKNLWCQCSTESAPVDGPCDLIICDGFDCVRHLSNQARRTELSGSPQHALDLASCYTWT